MALEIGAGTQDGFLLNPSWHRVYEFLSWTVVTFWDPFDIPLGFHAFPVKALMVALTATYAGMLLWGGNGPAFRPLRSLRNRGLNENGLPAWAALGLSFAGYLWYNLRFPQSDARLMFPSLAALLIVSVRAARAVRRGNELFLRPMDLPETESVC